MIGIRAGVGISRPRGLWRAIQALFAASEKGVWYDPSDLTAEKIAFRRNLLTYTEDFSNAVWGKNGTTVSPDSATAPDGSLTADKLINTATTGEHYLGPVGPGSLPRYMVSIYAKAGELSKIQINSLALTTEFARFDLSTGVVNELGTNMGPGTYSITSVGGGIYRVSAYVTPSAAGIAIQAVPDGVTGYRPSFTGDGTSGVYIWGAQSELGSTPTAYQKITNFNTEFMAAFPSHALYQESTGITPVTAVGQPVGMLLDKSKGLVLGPELVTNGTFDSNTTGWVAGFGVTTSTFTSVGGKAVLTQAGADTTPRFVTTLTGLVVGRTYKVRWSDAVRTGTGDLYLHFTSVASGTGGVSLLNFQTGSGEWHVVATATTMYLVVNYHSASAGATITVDNISVKELPGNHATQATSTARPILARHPISGKRNLLTYTELFGAAPSPWSKTGTCTDNAGIAPDGTMTAANLATGRLQLGSLVLADTTFSLYVNKVGTAFTLNTAGVVDADKAVFNLVTGVVTALGANNSAATITSHNADWWRVSVTRGATAGSTLYINLGGADEATRLIAKAQLEASATPTAYQKVVSAYDVTEAGVADAYHLVFDGVDDFMVTPSIDFSATDKMSVFAGVRKLGSGTIACLGVGSSTTTGSFAAGANDANFADTNNYMFRALGATGTSWKASSPFTAPHTAVLSFTADVALASGVDRTTHRVNSSDQSEVPLDTSGVGSGTFLNAPIRVGLRGDGIGPFNGHLYSLIVRGALSDAAQIAAAESYVNSKTGAY